MNSYINKEHVMKIVIEQDYDDKEVLGSFIASDFFQAKIQILNIVRDEFNDIKEDFTDCDAQINSWNDNGNRHQEFETGHGSLWIIIEA
jgi:hypothetical protein